MYTPLQITKKAYADTIKAGEFWRMGYMDSDVSKIVGLTLDRSYHRHDFNQQHRYTATGSTVLKLHNVSIPADATISESLGTGDTYYMWSVNDIEYYVHVSADTGSASIKAKPEV